MPRPNKPLPSDIAALLRQCNGLLDVRTAREVGIPTYRLRRLANNGLLVRLAQGVYASAETVENLDAWALFELTSRAFLFACSPDTYLSDWSAIAVWELPTLGLPPKLPVVVRPKHPGLGPKTSASGLIRVANVPEHHLIRRRRTRLVSQEWAAATVALSAPVPTALIVADAAARRTTAHRATSRDSLLDAIQYMAGWPGITRARWVAMHADPLAESPVETLGRFASIAGGLPMPVSNAWVGAHEPEFRVDGLWPYHHAANEGDGAFKYNNRPDAAKVVFKQNEREWRLRRLGLDLARYGFEMAAFRRGELIARFAQLLQDNPPRQEPIRWWKHVPGFGPVEPEPEDWPSPHPPGIILPANWWQPGR